MATDQQSDLKLNMDTSKINENNKFIVEFTRPLKVKGSRIKNKQTFAYAYGTLNPEDKDIDAYLPRHDYRGNIKLNLAEGGSELSHYDKLIVAHGKYRYVIWYIMTIRWPATNLIVHLNIAALMFSAWLIIIPGAVFIARFARNFLPTTWFKLHVGIQAFLSLPVMLAGSALSFAAAGNLKFDDPHKVNTKLLN